MARKKKWFPPVPKEFFLSRAKAVPATLGSDRTFVQPREFASGSYGWYYQGKHFVEVGGEVLAVQVGITVTVIGSKPEKPGAPDKEDSG